VDFWSFSVLTDELARLYAGELRGEPAQLSPIKAAYTDFVAHQRALLGSPEGERLEAYWKECFRQQPRELVLTSDESASASGAGGTIYGELPASLAERVQRFARAADTTPFVVLLTAYAAFLHQLSGQTDFVIGVPTSCRSRQEFRDVVGFFANTLPLRIEVAPSASFKGSLRALRRSFLSALAHEALPFSTLVERVGPRRGRGRSPLFNAMFVFHEVPRAGQEGLPLLALGEAGHRFELHGLELESLESRPHSPQCDLSLVVAQTGARILTAWEFDSSRFEPSTISAFGDRFTRLVEAALAEPDRQLSELLRVSGAKPSDSAVRSNAEPRTHKERQMSDLATFPAAYSQQRLWFLHELDRTSAAYNMPAVVRVRGNLDTEAFVRALNEVVRRHQSLRTTFLEIAGEPVQVVAARLHVPAPIVDLRRVEDQDAQVTRICTEEAQRPFDLGTGPLLRMQLLRVADEEWLLLVTMHHIVSDGWSTGVLVNELCVLYRAYRAGLPSPLRELSTQYSDFAIWQRENLQGKTLEAHLEYWKRELEGAAVLALPTDRPRPVPRSTRGSHLRVELSREASARVKALARGEASSSFMVLLAAFEVLLWRWSGQRDIVVGTPVANRNRRETEELIGFFVNTLALRTRLSPDRPFRELLRGVKRTTLEAYAHQDLPFEKLVDLLRPNRDLSRSPLFDVMFILQNAPSPPLELSGVSLELEEAKVESSKFDLTVSAFDHDGRFVLVAEYNVDLYDRGTIERLLGQYAEVLARVGLEPDASPRVLGGVSDADRARLSTWNDTVAFADLDRPVFRWFEDLARERPDLEAVSFGDRHLDYGELDRQTNRLARRLSSRGVRRGDVVAVLLERSIELVIALMAIVKAGGAYLPLDPQNPRARLSLLLEDSGAKYALGTRALLSNVDEAPLEMLAIDELDWASESAELLETAIGGDDLAYVIFTSGSSGRPKGVMCTHRGLTNRLLWMQSALNLTSSDRVVQKTPYTFDVSVWEFFWPLMTGASIVVAEPGAHKDPVALARLFIERGVTIAHFVPPMLRAFLAAEEARRCGSLRAVVTSGEALSSDLRDTCLEVLDAELHNLYGPTEAAIDVTAWRCRTEDGPVVPIGRPIANTQIHVLDDSGDLVPVGVPGELCIGGVQLARGYLNRPDLTAERFVPDARGGVSGGRLYRTGDLGRYRADGSIEFLGRLDFQVKVRGFHIELQEIEACLRSVEGVADATVVALPDGHGAQRLVAYWTKAPPSHATGEALKERLRELLPDYMIPSAFVALEKLPLSPNGKVDRKALPAPDFGSASEREFAEPATATERSLAAAWQRVLGIRRVGRHDDFFQLGGHSLLATQVVSIVRTELEREIPLLALFESTTLSELAARVDAAPARGLSAVVPRQHTSPAPASFQQERLWLVDQLEPGSAAYNMPAALELRGVLDVPALAQAMQAIVNRHGALRTTFALHEDSVVQIVAERLPLELGRTDLSERSPSEREGEIRRRVFEWAAAPFDLARGPLVRAHLLCSGPNEHVLLLALHHVVADGWSVGIFVRELAAAYEAFAFGRPLALPELPIQYADFAAWQRGWLSGTVLEKQLLYWKQALAGVPALLELPTDRPRPAIQTFRGQKTEVRFERELLAALRALALAQGATLFMVLLAAFETLLHRWSGQDDVVIGSPIANRTRSETEGLIGFFVNTLPLRARFEDDPRFTALLARIRATTLEAYAHQDIPFEKLVELLQVPRDTAHGPLFQTLFALQNTAIPEFTLGDLHIAELDAFNGTAKFDLVLSLAEHELGLIGTLEYNSDLFDAATIERLVRQLGLLLDQAARAPETRVSKFALVDREEREALLAVNRRVAEFDCARFVDELVLEACERSPDAPAIVFREQTLSYRELVERSEGWARALASRGIGRGSVVGVLTERSIEQMVVLLGILRTGAVYLPLDPAFPADRLALMLDDAGARCVLAQEHLADRLLAGNIEVHTIRPGGVEAGDHAAYPRVPRDPDDLSYIIYTSGSTGRPKGTGASHRNIARLVLQDRYAALDPTSRVLCYAPLAFDASTFEIWGPLARGGTVVVAPPGLLGLDELRALIAEHGVTTVFLTTALFHELVDGGMGELTGLRELMTGGEIVSVGHMARAVAQLPTCRFSVVYGPTETTTFATSHPVRAEDLKRAALPIGGPIALTEVYVLDRHLDLAPMGVAGELYIGGAGVTRGYLGNPDLTAARFVPDPFSDRRGARMYRTGDLCRITREGLVDFIGRTDHQVKIRGFRVELGEVEAALRRLPAIQDAIVDVRQSPVGKHLCAYCTPRVASELDVNAIRSALGAALPGYMIPTSFVVLATFPLTPNGKVDRKALAALRVEAALSAQDDPPRTEVERMIAGVFQEILQIGSIGVNSNFFELGAHSLALVRAHARLVAVSQKPLRVVDLFRHPTVSALAAHLGGDDPNAEGRARDAGHDRAAARRGTAAKRQELLQRRKGPRASGG
jgi:amino acid adenylation domain-containing protein